MSVKARQAPLWPLMALATLIAVMAFVLSFDALRTLGIACGIQPALGWMFPLIVDVPVLAFTWATWVFKTRGMGQGYPWAMLILFSAVSLVGNALHAHPVETNGMLLPDWTASLLMTMPPIALLATSHMMVTAASRSYDLETVEPEQPEEAEPPTEELWPIESEQPDEEPIEEPEAVEKAARTDRRTRSNRRADRTDQRAEVETLAKHIRHTQQRDSPTLGRRQPRQPIPPLT